MAGRYMNIEDEIKLIIKELKNKKEFGQNLEESDLDGFTPVNSDFEEYKKSELAFLNSVKDRILVLFEGLSNFDKGDIEARVELNLKFMEFLLATIDKRVGDIKGA